MNATELPNGRYLMNGLRMGINDFGQPGWRWMGWCGLLLLIASVSFACHGQTSSSEAKDIIQGTWVIKSIYRTQNVEGPNPSQQKKLVGSHVIVSAQSLHACGQSVPVQSIEVHRLSSDDFLTNTRVRFSEVQIHSPSVTEVIMNNRQDGICFQVFPLPGQDVFIKSKDEILISFEGVFYKAVRKK
jgi:hypothetical protein